MTDVTTNAVAPLGTIFMVDLFILGYTGGGVKTAFSASRRRSGTNNGSKFAEKIRDEESRVCANLTGKWPNGDRKYTSAGIKNSIKNFLFIFQQIPLTIF